MAYIGKIPAAAALTADDITDGIITNAKLAQDIISAETALGAEPADTDELLVSDAGTLKRMDYSHIKGGGAKTLLNTTTVSSDVSNINFDNSLITTTYQVYEIIIEFLQTDAGSGNEIQMAYSSDNGSSFKSSLDEVLTRDRNDDTGTATFRETATDQSTHLIMSGLEDNSAAFGSGVIKIFQPMTSSLNTLIRVDCQNNVPNHADDVRVVHGAVQIDEAVAINYIRIQPDSGNISAAKVKLYGVT